MLTSIKSVGSYLPSGILTNADLEKMVETSDTWIRERTGIVERRIAAVDETATDLAADRWVHRFDLFDQVRALENQIVWLSANQSGAFGRLRFVASARARADSGKALS